MKIFSFQTYCIVSFLSLGYLIYQYSKQDQSFTLIKIYRNIVAVNVHYVICMNFIIMLSFLLIYMLLKFFFSQIKEGQKLLSQSVNEKLKNHLLFIVILIPGHYHIDILKFTILPLFLGCLHWIWFKRIKIVSSNPNQPCTHAKMISLALILFLIDCAYGVYLERKIDQDEMFLQSEWFSSIILFEVRKIIVEVNVIQAYYYSIRLVGKVIRYFIVLNDSRKIQKDPSKANNSRKLVFQYISLFTSTTFLLKTSVCISLILNDKYQRIVYTKGFQIASIYLIFKIYTHLIKTGKQIQKIRTVKQMQNKIKRYYLNLVYDFSLPTMTNFQHDSTCIVCLDQMQEAKLLPCKHYFHEECLKNWLQQFNSCPMCKASVNLSDENKQGSDDKGNNKIQHKIESIRGKPRTDKLKVDIRRLERYKMFQQQLQSKSSLKEERSQQRKRSDSIQQEFIIDITQPNSHKNQIIQLQSKEQSNQVDKNQPRIEELNQEDRTLHVPRNDDISELSPQSQKGSNQFQLQKIIKSPNIQREIRLEQRTQVDQMQFRQFWKEISNNVRKQANRQVNYKKQVHKKEKNQFLQSDINVGSVIYSLPRPPPTRRTIESQINRKMIEIVNAKFTVLYKRPPPSGIPADILQILRKN